MTRDEILSAMDRERDRQHDLWHGTHLWGHGDCSDPELPMVIKAAVLTEEVGEFTQAILNSGPDTAGIDQRVRLEAIQVLAVAFAILEGME